jgi:hypothetical protein
MKVGDISSGEDITIADEFAVSNEVWPDHVLDRLAYASGDAAAIIGSGNAPNILSMIDGLGSVTFMDIAPGHGRVFTAKLNAVKSGEALETALGAGFVNALASEAGLFDLIRDDAPLHFSTNEIAGERFANLPEDLVVIDRGLNVLDDSKACLINPGSSRLAWLHLSNVVPYCVERGAKDVERKLFAFVDDLPGIDDDTVVTFSKRSDILVGDMNIRRLLVEAARLDDIVFSDFLNNDSISMSAEGTLIVRAVA